MEKKTSRSELDIPKSVKHSRSAAHSVGQPTSLTRAILPLLREAIVSGAFAPGTRLSEVQLAQQFKTSRTPVREALVLLEREEFVAIVPHVGAYVRTVAAQDVQEVYDIRGALEELAVSLAAARLTRVGEAQIAEVIDELTAAGNARDDGRLANALDAFHLLIVHLAGNERLERLYESLVGPIRRLRRINLRRPDRIEESVRANRHIADAIVARNPDAPRYMREHLRNVCKQLKELAQNDQAQSASDGDEAGT